MQVFGLIGNPVGHSLSPPLHEAAYEALEIDARYVTFEPAPETLETAIEGAKALGISGLNVTIPFKERVSAYVTPTELADRIGAINTIDFSTTPPTGYNTDAIGAKRALDHHNVELDETTTVLVGAGGAGRAIAYALTDVGSQVFILNRTVARAETLASEIGPNATAGELTDLTDLVPDADLVINATSVGMEEDRSPVPSDVLHDGLTVMDIVYQPLQTRLLQEANAAGAKTIDGGWMLLFQGVAAFEHWTNQDAPVDAMNTTLRRHL